MIKVKVNILSLGPYSMDEYGQYGHGRVRTRTGTDRIVRMSTYRIVRTSTDSRVRTVEYGRVQTV
jgi:hypothetical protein